MGRYGLDDLRILVQASSDPKSLAIGTNGRAGTRWRGRQPNGSSPGMVQLRSMSILAADAAMDEGGMGGRGTEGRSRMGVAR